MNANERRVLYCEALAFLHAEKKKEEKTEALRLKLNDISKAFAKTLKVLTKKKMTVKQEQPEVFTKKQWKQWAKKEGVVDSEEAEQEEDEDAE